MKRIVTLLLSITLVTMHIQAQSLYNYLGQGERNDKDLRKMGSFAIPQLRVGFETYSVKTVFVQEGRASAMASSLATIGTNKSYNRQGSTIEASAILNSNMEKEDFQQLTEDFQTIMEDALEAAGLKVHRLADLGSFKEYGSLEDKFSKKTAKLNEKKEESELGNKIVYYLPENGLMMYDGSSIGWAVPTIVKVKKMTTKNDVILMIKNVDVDFSFIMIEGSVKGGWNRNSGANYKNTEAKMEVLPVMNVKDVKLSLAGSTGSVAPTPIVLKDTYTASKSYEASLYQDAKKSESLFVKLFAFKRKDIEFDPMIIEVDKEVLMNAARDLFKEYSKDFAETVLYATQNKK